MKAIRIATRKSNLALWQAEHVAARLRELYPETEVSLVPRSTFGDEHLSTPLAKLGGKALFLKELEQAMLDDEADIAVHSLKDIPAELPEGFAMSAICSRTDPFDAWVSAKYDNIDALPEGAVVGTSSLRRRSQVLHQRPDLQVHDLRGNVNTRLAKLDRGDFDAIILASAGLRRLGMAERITTELTPPRWVSAVGQGALAIEHLAGRPELVEVLRPLHDEEQAACVNAERAFNHELDGSCRVPIGAYACWRGDKIYLQGFIGAVDGEQSFRGERECAPADAGEAGRSLARELLDAGAREVLEALSEAS